MINKLNLHRKNKQPIFASPIKLIGYIGLKGFIELDAC